MNTAQIKISQIDFNSLSFDDQVKLIKNALNDPIDSAKVRYRNSTGKVILENGILYSLWCDQKIQLDAHGMRYVHMGSSAYTKQAFFYFRVNGNLVRTNTRDVWNKKNVQEIYATVIEKALKSFPEITECEIFVSSFKKDYRYANDIKE